MDSSLRCLSTCETPRCAREQRWSAARIRQYWRVSGAPIFKRNNNNHNGMLNLWELYNPYWLCTVLRSNQYHFRQHNMWRVWIALAGMLAANDVVCSQIAQLFPFCCRGPPTYQCESEIRRSLLNGYDNTVIPRSNFSTPRVVQVSLTYLTATELDVQSGTAEIFVWLDLTWNDPRIGMVRQSQELHRHHFHEGIIKCWSYRDMGSWLGSLQRGEW
jgi:hypothetical protein